MGSVAAEFGLAMLSSFLTAASDADDGEECDSAAPCDAAEGLVGEGSAKAGFHGGLAVFHRAEKPTPQFFFAPTQVEKRRADWGAAGFQQRVQDSWRDFLSARVALDELLAESPDDFDLIRMGVMISAGNSDVARARELGRRLVEKHADKPEAFGLVVEMYDRIGDIDEAERVYELLVQSPATNAGATLGRVLFYDKRLSRDGTISCSSCHQQSQSTETSRSPVTAAPEQAGQAARSSTRAKAKGE